MTCCRLSTTRRSDSRPKTSTASTPRSSTRRRAFRDAINLVEDAQLRLACVRAYNDWIAEFCAHDPARLIGLGKIPSGSPEVAREELLRCVGNLGLRGVILDAWPGGSVATSPDDEPFWATVHETGVPVSIHYALGVGVDTLPPGGRAPAMRPPMADAPLPLVVAGIFDRNPNVRLVFAHGDAGWALHWLEFMDINYVRHRHLDEYKLQNAESSRATTSGPTRGSRSTTIGRP